MIYSRTVGIGRGIGSVIIVKQLSHLDTEFVGSPAYLFSDPFGSLAHLLAETAVGGIKSVVNTLCRLLRALYLRSVILL